MPANEASRAPLLGDCSDSTPRDRQNLRRVLWAVGAWALTFTAASQLIKRGLLPDGAISWVAAAVPAIVGIYVLLAFRRFLQEADELQRAIQLQALALGFGGGWLAMNGYQVFLRVGAPAADGGDYSLVMTLFYGIGILIGRRRYR